MSAPRHVRISATGMYIPKKVLTNEDLVKMGLDTSDEWIRGHIGIRERRIASDEETTLFMGLKAARAALEKSSVKAEDIGMIISTGFPDYLCPSTSSLLQQELRVENAMVMDTVGYCSSFNYALALSRRFISDGSVDNALIVSSERLSSILDWSDRSTCVYFADAAGAALVEKSDTEGIIADYLGSFLGNKEAIKLQSGGSRHPATDKNIEENMKYVQMDGRAVWDFATRAFPHAVRCALDRAHLAVDDVDFLVSHQANMNIIKYCMDELGLPMDKTHTTIERYGNTVSASIPITLNEAIEMEKIREGDVVVLVGFGASLSYGANVLKWRT